VRERRSQHLHRLRRSPLEAHDTVNTILNRFARERGVQVTVSELAINQPLKRQDYSTVGQPFLPSTQRHYDYERRRAHNPPEGSKGEAVIVFPVSVSVDMRRPIHLVAPDFQDTAAVYENTNTFAAARPDAGCKFCESEPPSLEILNPPSRSIG